MKHVDEYRDPELCLRLAYRLHKAVVLVIDSLTHSPAPYYMPVSHKADSH